MPDGSTFFRRATRPFLTAVMFLTRIPCPKWVTHEPADLARSTVYFPVVGVLVGGIGAGVFWSVHLVWSQLVALVVTLAVVAGSTGAFHEDGLADTFDGFGGGWTTEQVLSIMKDSRIGTYGVVSLGCVLALKVGALRALEPIGVVWALVLGHVLGRWSSLPLIWRYDYVRGDSGTAAPFAATITPVRLGVGTVLAFGVVGLGMGLQALPVIVTAVLVTGGAGVVFRRRIGGITGDTLGAANQFVELSTYLVLAADVSLFPKSFSLPI